VGSSKNTFCQKGKKKKKVFPLHSIEKEKVETEEKEQERERESWREFGGKKRK